MSLRVPANWAVARERVLPVLRGVTRPAGSLRAARRGLPLVRRPVAPFLSELLVVDHKHTRTYVRVDHLESWGVSADAAWLQARANLHPTVGLGREGADGLWSLDPRDGYASSRLFLPGWLAAFADRTHGRPLAVAPHARALVVGDSGRPEQVDALLRLGFSSYREAGDPVSPMLYAPGPAGVAVPWTPPSDHPFHARARRNHLLLAGTEYVNQADDLEDVLDLAPYSLAYNPRQAFALCRWRQGSTALLPRTDVVVLEPTLAEPLPLAWDTLEPHLEPVPDLEPPRYRPRTWPSLRALRGRALELPAGIL